jgi:putative tryptophan/tyrosine transport system substrate-binding protein
MRRREFIGLLSSAAAWPVAARGQQLQRLRRIGVLMNYAEDDQAAQTRLTAFLQQMQQPGWSEGRNLLTHPRPFSDISPTSACSR